MSTPLRSLAGIPLDFLVCADFDVTGRREPWVSVATLVRAREVAAEMTDPARIVPMGRVWIEDWAGTLLDGPYHRDGPRPQG